MAVTLAVVTGAAPPASARPPRPAPVELVAPNSWASDINERGVVVGWRPAGEVGTFQGFRRSRSGHVTDLGPATPRAVNDRGEVAGERIGPDGTRRATRWDARGRAHDLNAGDDSWVGDINNRGVVVGYTPSALGYRAFVAVPGADIVLLPHPAGVPEHQDIATAVNERGDIVGTAVGGADAVVRPVVWRGPDHTPTLLPASGNYHSVSGINEAGTVSGTALDPSGDGYRPVVWVGRDHREVVILAPASALTRGVNDRGQVSGVLHDTSEAFVWDPRTDRTTILEGLSPYVDAFGLDDRGCVVGVSFLPDATYAATLFAPCPYRPHPTARYVRAPSRPALQ